MLTLVAAFALAAGAAQAQKIDANGKCHDAKGKFAKMEVCKRSAAAAPPASKMTYKLDSKGKCRDAKGRMAKKDMCKAS